MTKKYSEQWIAHYITIHCQNREIIFFHLSHHLLVGMQLTNQGSMVFLLNVYIQGQHEHWVQDKAHQISILIEKSINRHKV